MPITNEQINLVLSQQEEILLTLSEVKFRIEAIDKQGKKILEEFDGKPNKFSSGIRG